jgi:hypothetical protein
MLGATASGESLFDWNGRSFRLLSAQECNGKCANSDGRNRSAQEWLAIQARVDAAANAEHRYQNSGELTDDALDKDKEVDSRVLLSAMLRLLPRLIDYEVNQIRSELVKLLKLCDRKYWRIRFLRMHRNLVTVLAGSLSVNCLVPHKLSIPS